MQSVLVYKPFGGLAVAVLAFGLTFLVWKWPRSRHHTFSQHAAAHRHTILYYILLFSVVLPLLVLFFADWFVPEFRLSAWFSVCIVASAIAQYACTFVPEIGGKHTTYHQLLAGISAVLLLPSMVLLLASSIQPAQKVLVASGLLVMVSIVGLLMLRKEKLRNQLIFQAAYFAAFLIPVLVLSY